MSWLIRQGTVEERNRELYEYAAVSFITTFSPFVLTIVIGILINRMWEGVAIIFPFMILRKFSGGYHAKHMLTCLISSTALLTIVIYASTYVNYGTTTTLWLLISIISLVVNSPIDSENYRLDHIEKKLFRRIVIGTVIFLFFIYISLGEMGFEKAAVCVSLGVDLTAILQLPCFIEVMRGIVI